MRKMVQLMPNLFWTVNLRTWPENDDIHALHRLCFSWPAVASVVKRGLAGTGRTLEPQNVISYQCHFAGCSYQFTVHIPLPQFYNAPLLRFHFILPLIKCSTHLILALLETMGFHRVECGASRNWAMEPKQHRATCRQSDESVSCLRGLPCCQKPAEAGRSNTRLAEENYSMPHS